MHRYAVAVADQAAGHDEIAQVIGCGNRMPLRQHSELPDASRIKWIRADSHSIRPLLRERCERRVDFGCRAGFEDKQLDAAYLRLSFARSLSQHARQMWPSYPTPKKIGLGPSLLMTQRGQYGPVYGHDQLLFASLSIIAVAARSRARCSGCCRCHQGQVALKELPLERDATDLSVVFLWKTSKRYNMRLSTEGWANRPYMDRAEWPKGGNLAAAQVTRPDADGSLRAVRR